MCSFLISAAKQINGVLSARGAAASRRVFERYHARTLAHAAPGAATCLAYVLNNWRHHDEHRSVGGGSHWLVDTYASAVAFDGWKELGARRALHGAARAMRAPGSRRPACGRSRRGWLAARHGPVSVREVPGGDDDDRGAFIGIDLATVGVGKFARRRAREPLIEAQAQLDRASTRYSSLVTPVVLVHSGGFTSRQWRKLGDALAPAHPIVAPDLVGYSAATSRWPIGEPFEFQTDVELACWPSLLAEPIPVRSATATAG